MNSEKLAEVAKKHARLNQLRVNSIVVDQHQFGCLMSDGKLLADFGEELVNMFDQVKDRWLKTYENEIKSAVNELPDDDIPF